MDRPGSVAISPAHAQGCEASPPDAESSVVARIRRAVFDDVPAATRIGRYYLLDEVGRGGLGIVYSAFDPQLDRQIALKLVRPDRMDGGGRDRTRLLQEARALARVTHPNVVSVHDAGIHGDAVFVAMELVVGQTLTTWVREHAPAWQELRDLLVQAGRGLEAAHRATVVHRDFKPANVLVDEEGRVRVVDFGLARAAVRTSTPSGVPAVAPDESATRSGAVMGTPAYMAPEQFDGETSAASDQWAFCVTAYELFYGHRPFIASTIDELESVVRAGVVPEPADARGVPGWMLRTLRQGLRVDPRDRHRDMAELLDALQADSARRRHRVRVAVVLASALALGLVAAGTLDIGRDPIAQASIEMLDAQARAAADGGAFIYPPVEDPGAATAYSTVMALESLGDDRASQRAAALRVEFADALVAMGDRYWEIDGGRGFASDFYAAALLFQPERSALRERTAITIGEFAQLRRRAEAGEFTQAELQGAAVLSALAEPDDDAGAVRLERLTRNDTALPSSVRVDAQRVLAQRVPERASPAVRGAEQNSPVVASAPAASSRPALGSGPASDAAVPSTGTASPAAAPTAHVDADAARRAIGQGRVHLKAGEFAAAETSFHRALEADARSHEALSGLSEVYFNRAAHQKALSFAKRAVTLAPRRAEYRMQLGDAYFKVLRYDDARAEYEAALDLGHARAKDALARLRSRLGEDR